MDFDRKREIAEEGLEPGVSPVTLARRYGSSGGVLYTWRRLLLKPSLGSSGQPDDEFCRIEITAVPAQVATVPPEPEYPTTTIDPVNRSKGMIEITLPDGERSGEYACDSSALHRVFAARKRPAKPGLPALAACEGRFRETIKIIMGT
jgi:transposase-like protein